MRFAFLHLKAINFTFIHSLIHNITNDSLALWFQESSGDVEVLSAGQSAINLWVKLSNLMSYVVNHISVINLSFSECQRFSVTKLITLCPSSFLIQSEMFLHWTFHQTSMHKFASKFVYNPLVTLMKGGGWLSLDFSKLSWGSPGHPFFLVCSNYVTVNYIYTIRSKQWKWTLLQRLI